MQSLAKKFRPKNLDEFVGQKRLLAPDAPLYKLIKSKKIPHSLFFGSSGSGKTTLARIIASELGISFFEMDAATIKVDEVRAIINKFKDSLLKPLIFIDEIHRLSKTQQEVLLKPMEEESLILIGASTENPYFVLSSAFRSRSMLFEFEPLSSEDLENILLKTLEQIGCSIEKEAMDYLIFSSSGDARAMLNLLEYAFGVQSNITLEVLKILRSSAMKGGAASDDVHYDLISAMIKSIRGSDADAALYYMARLIDEGESADFIARRLVILASEDVGNANPNALLLSVGAMEAVSKIGFPEARIILAQCAVYLACSPKSNSSYLAINRALDYVKNNPKNDVPLHLKSPSRANYLYPHDFGGWVEQEYFTDNIIFYQSFGIGFEKTLNEWISKIKKNFTS